MYPSRLSTLPIAALLTVASLASGVAAAPAAGASGAASAAPSAPKDAPAKAAVVAQPGPGFDPTAEEVDEEEADAPPPAEPPAEPPRAAQADPQDPPRNPPRRRFRRPPPPPPADDEDLPPPPPPRYRRPGRVLVRKPQGPPPDARSGLILSMGVGGGSFFTSVPGLGTTGAPDFDFRIGYGFSDRFQLLIDIDSQAVNYGLYSNYGTVSNWTATLRGQTVLFGDKKGNGLAINGGIGLGGLNSRDGYTYDYPGTYSACAYNYNCSTGSNMMSSQVGFAVGGGISFDGRVGQHLAISPEVFGSWHSIPNGLGRTNDIATIIGLRLNLVWYIH